MEKLKLIAFDADDLAVISAHLQDALLKVEDIAYLPRQKRFAAVGCRFDWARAIRESATQPFTRCESALRLERVLGARLTGIDLERKQDVLSLLAIQFTPINSDDPEGHITLYFAGGGAIRLHVECIEVELRDLGDPWQTPRKPEHRVADPAGDDLSRKSKAAPTEPGDAQCRST
jgi:hypothetical protein